MQMANNVAAAGASAMLQNKRYVCIVKKKKKKKKKDFTRFCQPTQPITCANHGTHVQILMKSRQSTT